MRERYCFYCGNQLGPKEVCPCRQSEKFSAQFAYSTQNPGQTTKTLKINKFKQFFLNAQARLQAFRQNSTHYLEHLYTLRNLLGRVFYTCLFPANANVAFASFKPLTSYILAALNALILAVNFHLLLTNSTLGRILSLYLTPVMGAAVAFNAWTMFLRFWLLSFLIFLAKAFFYRYVLAAWGQALSFKTVLRVLNGSLVYSLFFNLLALCFANYSPIQFVLVCMLGQSFAFYLEVKAVCSDNLRTENKALILLALVNFVLIALTAFFIRTFIPELMIFNIV